MELKDSSYFHKCLILQTTRSQSNAISISMLYFFKINFIIIFSSALNSSKQPLFPKLFDQISVNISHLPRFLYVKRSSYSLDINIICEVTHSDHPAPNSLFSPPSYYFLHEQFLLQYPRCCLSIINQLSHLYNV
jgi:hypothetical protein